MSVKTNQLLLAVYSVISVAPPVVAASPVLEGLLNDYSVDSLQVVQVDDRGRCIVMATVRKPGQSTSALRPVASLSGDVKLYADMGAVFPLIQRAKISASSVINMRRKDKPNNLADPVAALRRMYKAFIAERTSSERTKTRLEASILASTALGRDVSVGTPERAEHDDLLARVATVNESIAFTSDKIVSLAASLVAAGINPATVI